MSVLFDGYFSANDIKAFAIPNGQVKIPVYNNGEFEFCPCDLNLCEQFNKQYLDGSVIRIIYSLTKESYCILRYGIPTRPIGYDAFLDG